MDKLPVLNLALHCPKCQHWIEIKSSIVQKLDEQIAILKSETGWKTKRIEEDGKLIATLKQENERLKEDQETIAAMNGELSGQVYALKSELTEARELLARHHHCQAETDLKCVVCSWLAANREKKAQR